MRDPAQRRRLPCKVPAQPSRGTTSMSYEPRTSICAGTWGCTSQRALSVVYQRRCGGHVKDNISRHRCGVSTPLFGNVNNLSELSPSDIQPDRSVSPLEIFVVQREDTRNGAGSGGCQAHSSLLAGMPHETRSIRLSGAKVSARRRRLDQLSGCRHMCDAPTAGTDFRKCDMGQIKRSVSWVGEIGQY